MPDNMVGQLCAYGFVLWLCPVGPLLLIGLGIQVGKYGWRVVIGRAARKVFGEVKEAIGNE